MVLDEQEEVYDQGLVRSKLQQATAGSLAVHERRLSGLHHVEA